MPVSEAAELALEAWEDARAAHDELFVVEGLFPDAEHALRLKRRAALGRLCARLAELDQDAEEAESLRYIAGSGRALRVLYAPLLERIGRRR